MKDKNLLMKCVILLYKETLLKSKGLSSIDKINKVIEDVSSRVSPDLGGNMQNLDKIVNSNLIFRIREMAELGPEHEYDQTEFLNDLELDCDEDKLLFKVLKESILKDHTEEEVMDALINADVDVNDIENENDMIVVYTEVQDLNNAKKALETAFPGITFELDEISYFSKDSVTLSGEDKEKFEKLLTMLDDLDDVSNVYHNVEL